MPDAQQGTQAGVDWRWAVIGSLLGQAALAQAGEPGQQQPRIEVEAPDWVSLSEPLPVPDGAQGALFVRRSDLITRLTAKGEAAYLSQLVRILQPGALDLVQQQVRYVYVGLGGGTYLPASADETWNRRYGDCKGKTALLLALLGELGIAAWDSVEKVTYRFDEATRASILTIAGTGPIEWEQENGYTYTRLPGGGFNPPPRRQRPAGESRDAPFYTEPSYTCHVTTMRLPADTRLEEWSVNSSIETILFGRIFYRRMQLAPDHTLRLVRGSRVEAPEIPGSTAERDNGRLARFDNSMALLTWTKDAREDHSHAQQPVPATFAFDWTSAAAPCLPENLRTAP